MQTARTRLSILAVSALIALLAATMPASPAWAQTALNALDLDGDNNVARAISWSQATYTPLDDTGPTNPPTGALIGRQDLFADNLAAGSLMGAAVANGRPLFLTDTNSLASDVETELLRILPEGATVTLLGGQEALSDGVAADLADAGFTVERLEGETRTETAIDIAQQSQSDTVLVVRSTGSSTDPTQEFADSLAAGALAATNGWEILFTNTDSLNSNTAEELAIADYTTAYVVGGELAISSQTFDAISEIVPTTSRVAGETRFATAVELNALREGEIGDVFIVVDGQTAAGWTDGFPAANLSGLNNYPLVLVNGTRVPDETAEFLASRRPVPGTSFANHFDGVGLVCGSTVAEATCSAALAALNGNEDGELIDFPSTEPVGPVVIDNPTFTEAPELLNVQLGDVTDDNTVVASFAFDETVKPDAINAGCFHLYRFDLEAVSADDNEATDCAGDEGGHATDVNANPISTDGRTATIDPDDDTVVNVTFNINEVELALVSVATVDWAAVVDADDVENLEGTYDLNEGTIERGATVGPTLEAIDAIGTVTNSAEFDFDTDLSTTITTPTGFSLILDNGDVLVSDTAGLDSDDPSIVIATFTNAANDDLADPEATGAGTITTGVAGMVARGAVAAGSVSDAANDYPADLSVVAIGTGLTDDPDLTSVALGSTEDTLQFTFDVAVELGSTSECAADPLPTGLAPTPEACFLVENVQGTDTAASSVAIVGNDAKVVVATFEDGALDDAVAAFVNAGAVTDTSGAEDRNNEVGRVSLDEVIFTAGQTLGPDLVSVAVETLADNSRALAFTFDSDVVATNGAPITGDGALPDASRFFSYTAEGSPARGVAATISDDDESVVLVTFGATNNAIIDGTVTATVNDGAVEDADGQANIEGAGGELG